MREITAKSILSANKNPGFWFNSKYNINLYRGCVFGCIYCDSRSDCYHVDHFDEIALKVNGLELLEAELKTKKIKGIVGMGAMTDPYNPFEKKAQYTRKALELIDHYGFGVHLCTKSILVERDIDLFTAISQHSHVSVGITITTHDDELASRIECHAPSSSLRFKALETLSKAGIFCGVMMMPVMPFINDTLENMESIVDRVYESGARFIAPWFGVTMRDGQREYLYKGLDQHFPGMKERYVRTFGSLYECKSPHHAKLQQAFTDRCRKLGILYRMEDIIKGAEDAVQIQQSSFGL